MKTELAIPTIFLVSKARSDFYLDGLWRSHLVPVKDQARLYLHLCKASDATTEPLFVSVEEAARLLGLGRTFTWELVKNGEVQSRRFGHRVLIPRVALEQMAGIENVGEGE